MLDNAYDQMRSYYGDIINDKFNDLYQQEDRKEEVTHLVNLLQLNFRNKRVLELAAGGGFWTANLAKVARHVTAVDLNIDEVRKLKEKFYRILPIQHDLMQIELLDEAVKLNKIDSCFASCWISHIVRKDLYNYLKQLSSLFAPGTLVVFIDSIFYSEGKPIYTFESGDQYQIRTMNNGEEVKIVKNFYTADDWKRILNESGAGDFVLYSSFKHYYILEYRAK